MLSSETDSSESLSGPIGALQAERSAVQVSASAVSPEVAIAPGGFDPSAWDHWMLLGVMAVVSVWTLRTSAQWRREWRQYCRERQSHYPMR